MELSVVVPVYNESGSIESLYGELIRVLASLGVTYELIFVDDGSGDDSFSTLKRLHEANPRVVVVRLSRNYGQTAALAAGLAHSQGEDVITMDGDGQNDPADIPVLLEQRRRGFDLVSGWRVDRKDPWLSRRLPSRAANWIIGHITGARLHDYGCTLKLLRGDLARSLRLYGEMHRFIPALVDDLGGRIAEVPVNHRARMAGRSKYGISRTLRVILDLITVKFLSSFSTRPIHIFGILGLIAAVVGGGILGWLALQKICFGARIGERPLLLLGALLSIMGVQFVSIGLLGELLVRTYHESQGKPVYRVAEVLPGLDH